MTIRYALLCLSPDFSGLEIHVRDYALWLAKRHGVQLHLILAADAHLNRALSDHGLPILCLPPVHRHLPMSSARRVAQWLDLGGIDILHSHWSRDLPLAAIARRCSRKKPKLIHSQHLLPSPRGRHDVYHRAIYGALDGFITISHQMSGLAALRLPVDANRIRTVHPGVAPSPQLAVGGERFTVGCVGRVTYEKGQHLLLEAALALRQRGVQIRVVLAGKPCDRGYHAELHAFAQRHALEFEDRGFVEPEQAFAGMDAAVTCSTEEPFGLVTVEAMRRGICVVTAASGGSLEIVRDQVDGLMFPPGDALALAERLAQLVSDQRLRERLRVSALQRAADHFDAQTQFEKLFATALELAGLQAAAGAEPPMHEHPCDPVLPAAGAGQALDAPSANTLQSAEDAA